MKHELVIGFLLKLRTRTKPTHLHYKTRNESLDNNSETKDV